MIVTCNSQQLAQALRIVCKAVPSQPSIQILSYVLFEAYDELRLTTNGLDVGLSAVCAATITGKGKCALPAETLLRLIEQFSDGTVTLAADENGARVQYGTFSSRLQTLKADEFPMVLPEEGPTVTLPGDQLLQLIAAVRYAVAERGKKHILEAALLKLDGTAMGMIATDGTRLSIATAALASAPCTVLIPRRTLDTLAVLGTGTIMLHIGTKHLFFTAGEVMLTSGMIDGTFPAYERIIPRTNDKTAVIDRLRLAEALRRVGIAAEQNHAAYFSFTPDLLRISTRSVEVGEADEQFPIGYDGTPLTVCANWRYLLDFLNAAVVPTITIQMKSETSALLVSATESFINVIMTMRP